MNERARPRPRLNTPVHSPTPQPLYPGFPLPGGQAAHSPPSPTFYLELRENGLKKLAALSSSALTMHDQTLQRTVGSTVRKGPGKPGEVRKGRRQEDKTGSPPSPAPPPAHHARGDRREAPRSHGRGDKSQQPQGHGSAVCTGSRTRGDAVATGSSPPAGAPP